MTRTVSVDRRIMTGRAIIISVALIAVAGYSLWAYAQDKNGRLEGKSDVGHIISADGRASSPPTVARRGILKERFTLTRSSRPIKAGRGRTRSCYCRVG
jgi:hypothetical protein